MKAVAFIVIFVLQKGVCQKGVCHRLWFNFDLLLDLIFNS